MRVAFISRVVKDKGLDTVKQICEEYPESLQCFSIDFYGQKNDNYFDSELERFENLNYRGVLPPQEVIPTLRKYDALIFPTHYEGEGCPGILIEAMAAGLPIIASDWKYNSEFVTSGENGFLCSAYEPREYLEAMTRLQADLSLRKRMGESSKARTEYYSSENARRMIADWL